MKIGLIQTCSGLDPDRNARHLAEAASRLAAAGAEMIFTPEMCGLLDRDSRRLRAVAGPEDKDATLAALRDVARTKGVAISVGSLAITAGDDKLANRSFVIGADGDIIARYDKIHLFDVELANGERYRESASFAAGQSVRLADLPWGRMGLSICYDLRFPALHMALAQAGAQLISVPAAFTVPTGEAHWHVLLRARAIETGCYIVAAAQSGKHEDGRQTYGHSLVVDPWGGVLLDMGTKTGEALVEFDLSRVTDVRGRIPNLRHARPLPEPVVQP